MDSNLPWTNSYEFKNFSYFLYALVALVVELRSVEPKEKGSDPNNNFMFDFYFPFEYL